MAVATPAERIARQAHLLGFPLAGSAPLGALDRRPFLERWLAEGRAGEMDYLGRRMAERMDPRTAFPWARSIVSLAYPYRPPPLPAGDWRAELRGRIAAYALGVDYHDRVRALLERLIERLGDVFPDARFHPYVDTGPVLEREWAARAGLGWIGKNTLVLHRSAGSYFFLAELLTDLSIDAVPLPVDHCGTCTRCLTACPTGALEAYAMDPRRCISYLTIEHRSAIPRELRPHLANWIFGCDLCQQACPWNAGASDTDAAEALTPRLPPLLELDAAAFRARFGRTAVARAKRRGLLRNVAVVLGNSENPEAVPPLAAALLDPEPLVRGHAAWALGRLGGAAARHSLEAARARETDPGAAAEIEAALA